MTPRLLLAALPILPQRRKPARPPQVQGHRRRRPSACLRLLPASGELGCGRHGADVATQGCGPAYPPAAPDRPWACAPAVLWASRPQVRRLHSLFSLGGVLCASSALLLFPSPVLSRPRPCASPSSCSRSACARCSRCLCCPPSSSLWPRAALRCLFRLVRRGGRASSPAGCRSCRPSFCSGPRVGASASGARPLFSPLNQSCSPHADRQTTVRRPTRTNRHSQKPGGIKRQRRQVQRATATDQGLMITSAYAPRGSAALIIIRHGAKPLRPL
jgi:hypothetical protein